MVVKHFQSHKHKKMVTKVVHQEKAKQTKNSITEQINKSTNQQIDDSKETEIKIVTPQITKSQEKKQESSRAMPLQTNRNSKTNFATIINSHFFPNKQKNMVTFRLLPFSSFQRT